MYKTLTNVIGIVFMVILISSLITFILNIVQKQDTRLMLSGRSHLSDGKNLTVMWKTDLESDASVSYVSAAKSGIGVDPRFKLTHNVVIRNLTGLINYSITSCTLDGICSTSSNHTVTI